jgi:hypothetical protein
MHSFTSASSVKQATYLVIAGCVLVALGVEAVARVGLDRVSKTQRRTVDEYRQASAIGVDQPAGRKHLLVVGNSLLDEDVRFDDLRAALEPGWDARRFVVEQTYYLDWYFGLKRLFRAGARPEAVVLMLSTRQWIRNNSRGDYSAHYLMDIADVPAAGRELGLDLTQQTSLLIASVSKFWAARAEMRNFVLGHLMPDLGRLMDFSSIADPRPMVDAEVEEIARGRLERLKALTQAYGAELIVVLPVVLERNDGAAGFLRAAAAAGVTTLRPVESGAFEPRLYRDAGFHLNASGAAAFTERLIPALRYELTGVSKPAITARSW